MTMITKIQFQRGASVLNANGEQVATLERVVVDPANNVLTDIVVRMGGLLNADEKVVPLRLVAETSAAQVRLRGEAGDLESAPPFEEERLIEEHASSNAANEQHPVVVGYPVGGAPLIQASVVDGPVTRVEQNIPEGTVAVKEGASVVTSEGQQVGNLESVLANPAEEQITHLLISKGLLSKDVKLIPQKWISSWSEEKVYLRVKRDTVERLSEASLAG